MRVAVISDLHANLRGLEAVAEAIEQESPDEVWCLGDLVGYGPQPNACCAWVAAGTHLCLAGNHDLGVLGALDLDDFSPNAAAAAEWTRGTLSPDARAYLQTLSSGAEREGVRLYHASPRDPVWEYVLTWEAARDAIADSGAELTLVGHSHVPLAIVDGRGSIGGHAAGGTRPGLPGGRRPPNPGPGGPPGAGGPQPPRPRPRPAR